MNLTQARARAKELWGRDAFAYIDRYKRRFPLWVGVRRSTVKFVKSRKSHVIVQRYDDYKDVYGVGTTWEEAFEQAKKKGKIPDGI